MTYSDIQALALDLGLTTLIGKDLADYEGLSDGCSGRLSWAYAMAGRIISCHRACVAHDFLYFWGGNEAARKQADRLLRIAAARSGKASGPAAPLVRAWRTARAWLMYATVRLFGGAHWRRG